MTPLHHISQLVNEADELSLPTASVHRPRSPDATVPHILHRGHDGLVTFARKPNGNWQQLGAVSAAHLSGLFSNEFLADAMSVDSYFGLHGMYRPNRPLSSYGWQNQLPGMERYIRNRESVRWLTCFHVDLDSYRCGLDSHGAIAAMNRLVDAGLLPSPSLYTLSRGVWAIWRLHDREQTNEPLRAYPREQIIRRWAAIQDVLHRRCASIGSDPAARNPATLSRIPGSVNTKNGERVGYMIPASRYGKLYSYSLPDMESFFSDELRKRVVTVPVTDRIPDEKRKVLGKRGSTQRWHIMLERLNVLRDMRGGWRVGTRNHALLYVATACVNLGMEDAAISVELARHLKDMEPGREPVTHKEARQILRVARKGQTGRRGHVRNQTVADALMVTPDEAAILSANHRQPFPPAMIHGGPLLKQGKAESTAARRQAVERIVCHLKAQGIQPNGATVRSHLLAEGLDAALRTVLKDMEAIGHPSSLAHHKGADNPRLPGF